MTEINKREALRWAKAGCPEVWFRQINLSGWDKIDKPIWNDKLIYITDDSQSSLRMLQIEKPETIFELYDKVEEKWYTTTSPSWDINIKHRVKENKFNLKYYSSILVGREDWYNRRDDSISQNDIKFGRLRTCKQQGTLAFKSQIRQMRLGALIDQCGGQTEWKNNEKNWYLFKLGNKYNYDYNFDTYNPEKIYCEKQTAKEAVDILNKGLYGLELENV